MKSARFRIDENFNVKSPRFTGIFLCKNEKGCNQTNVRQKIYIRQVRLLQNAI